MQPTDVTLSFAIDKDVALPQRTISHFRDSNVDYLTFQHNNKILIYNISSGDWVKTITVETEGNNQITGGFYGYYMLNLNQMWVPSAYTQRLFLVNSEGDVVRKINFEKTNEGEMTVPAFFTERSTVCILDSMLYIFRLITHMQH